MNARGQHSIVPKVFKLSFLKQFSFFKRKFFSDAYKVYKFDVMIKISLKNNYYFSSIINLIN